MHTIYKICPASAWREAERQGVYRGSPDDARDGFIHFSTAAQVQETARRHFFGQKALFLIEVDADARRIHLHVADDELARRRSAWRPPAPHYQRGYGAMYSAHIGQADEGCDFDFLLAGERIPEPEIH